MKATEQYFPMVLFIMPYKVVLTLSLRTNHFSVTVQIKATEQFVHLLFFVSRYLAKQNMLCFACFNLASFRCERVNLCNECLPYRAPVLLLESFVQ